MAESEQQVEVMRFDHGLTDAQVDLLDEMRMALGRMIQDLETLPRHRSLSLAVTKIDEASHWLRDRQHRAP